MTVTTVVKVMGASRVVEVVEGEINTVVSRVEVLDSVVFCSTDEVIAVPLVMAEVTVSIPVSVSIWVMVVVAPEYKVLGLSVIWEVSFVE